jgi:PKD repeat protein
MTISEPKDGSVIDTLTPSIVISFNDSQSGLDLASLFVEINGTDNTSLFDVTPTMASYQVSTPLPLGENTITARIGDKVGNEAITVSNFEADPFRVSISASPSKGGVPFEVRFGANITAGTPPFNFDWDVDGDSVSDDTRASFNHIYNTPGVYNAKVTVRDNRDKIVSDEITIYALSTPVVFGTADPSMGGAPLDVRFSATVNDPDGAIVLYEWDFNGDGTFEYSDPDSATTSYQYTATGPYQATIRVTDNDGLMGYDTILIIIGISPVASAQATPLNGLSPLLVDFSGNGTDSDGTIKLYEWDFDGDGIYDWSSPDSGDTTYTYESSGVYDASMRITDNDGLNDTDSVLISISGPPISKPRGFPTSGNVPLTVTFFSDGNDLDGSPEYYHWDFDGDGIFDRRLIASMNTTYTYSQAGIYNATLKVTDNEGFTSSESIPIIVLDPDPDRPPTAFASAYPDNGGIPLTVTLIGNGNDSNGTITKYEWDVHGDGFYDWEEAAQVSGPVGTLFDVGGFSDPFFADLDNDGDTDMISGESSGRFHYYENKSSGKNYDLVSEGFLTFSNGGTLDIWLYSSPELADMDDDGDLDLISGRIFGEIFYYENIGSSSAPIWNAVGYLTNQAGTTIDSGSDSRPDLVDIDNDGDLDLLVGNSLGTISYYENVGTKSAPLWSGIGLLNDINTNTIDVGRNSSPELADIDNDGDMDLFVGDWSGNIHYFENTGNSSEPFWTPLGTISLTSGTLIDTGSVATPLLLDFDHDGDLDLLSGNSSGRILYYRNVGDMNVPKWVLATSRYNSISVSSYSRPAFADLDNDDDQDLFLGSSNGTVLHFQNEGTKNRPIWIPLGGVMDKDDQTIDVNTYSDPTLADIDNDKDSDLFIGDRNGNIHYYRNEGDIYSPVWTSVGLLAHTTGTIDIGFYSRPAFVDIDKDEDLDLFVGGSGGRIYFYRNDGDINAPEWVAVGWIINAEGSTIDVGSYSSPTFMDVDRDGDPDLFIGTYFGKIYFYRNEGNETSPLWELVSRDYRSISQQYRLDPAFVDIDDDGDLDLFFGNSSGLLYYYPTLGGLVHVYNIPGPNKATLRVTDNDGLSATDSVTIQVLDQGSPTAISSVKPVSGEAPLAVSFNGKGTDTDGTIVLYEWDFDGDGVYEWSDNNSANTVYTFNNMGDYVATLRVTDNDGKTSTTSVYITVSLGLTALRTPAFNPNIDENGTITFTTTDEASITVKVVDQSGNLVKTMVNNETRGAGTYSEVWNGRNDTGQIVRDGVYYFLIDYTAGDESGTFDLREHSGFEELTPPRSWPSTFNPIEGSFVSITYTLDVPSEVSLYFWTRDYSRSGSSIAPVRTLLVREPRAAGTHTEVWDGINDKGAVVEPGRDYPVTLWAYALPDNAIIIQGARPELADISATPGYFSPAYNPYGVIPVGYTTLSFNLSESTNIELDIKNSSGVLVRTIRRVNLPAGTNAVIWDGKDNDGNLVKEGTYSISLIAIDDSGNRSLPRYAAVIIFY